MGSNSATLMLLRILDLKESNFPHSSSIREQVTKLIYEVIKPQQKKHKFDVEKVRVAVALSPSAAAAGGPSFQTFSSFTFELNSE